MSDLTEGLRQFAEELDPEEWHVSYRLMLEEAVLAVERIDSDPLRDLLADEDRLIEWVTETRWRADEAVWRAEFGRSEPRWADVPEWSKQRWREETRSVFGGVLAALREVASSD